MSKKNIFILAAWYVAGWIISALYNKKKPEELKKDLTKSRKSWEWDFKVMLNNFVDTHENLLDDLKNNILSDKNKKLFTEKKDELLNVVDVYKKQWEELVEDLKVKWKDFIVEASDNLSKLYEEKKDEIEELKGKAKEVVEEVKEKTKK
mgnify:CR=1 FL=1